MQVERGTNTGRDRAAPDKKTDEEKTEEWKNGCLGSYVTGILDSDRLHSILLAAEMQKTATVSSMTLC